MNSQITINSSNYSSFSYLTPYIRYCAEDKYISPWELPRRKINDYELLFFTGGKGTFTIEDRTYDVKENDLLLFKPQIFHYGWSVKQPFSFLCMHFDIYASKSVNTMLENEKFIYESVPSRPVKFYKAELDFPEYTNAKDSTYVQSVFRRILSESHKREPGYNMVLKSLFIELLFSLFRQSSSTYLNQQPANPEIDFVIEFLKKNYMEKLHLSEISKQVHLQPTYLSGLFRKHTGVTITDFLNIYRITLAKEMLSKPEHRMSDIAIDTGFYDVHHFSRVFKKYEGLTPRDYRKINITP